MEPADRVIAIAPLMRELLNSDRSFLTEAHYRSDADHYARNAIHSTPMATCRFSRWSGCRGNGRQCTTNGSWGVVGVLEGLLEERAYMAADGDITADNRHPASPRRRGAAQSRWPSPASCPTRITST